MAKENGKRYDETFKKETVTYILENNKPVAQAARETGRHYLLVGTFL